MRYTCARSPRVRPHQRRALRSGGPPVHDAIEGRPGLTELADVAAVHTWAVEKGLADPARCVVTGASWGGYLSLLALGTQPDQWALALSAMFGTKCSHERSPGGGCCAKWRRV